MELWGPDIEAMRGEARQAVEQGIGPLLALDPPEISDDPDIWAKEARARLDHFLVLSEAAEERVIAGVRCRVFRPDGPPRGVYVHLHGGGMISGSPELSDIPNEGLSRSLGLAVVSVGYRLAPEHPFPAGIDDCVAVARWLFTGGAAELGAAGRPVVIGGESAGAYLTACVLLRLRQAGIDLRSCAGALLIFGVYDWSGTPSQRGARAEEGPDLLSPAKLAAFRRCYLPGRSLEDCRDPSVSPLYAELAGLPPAFMSVGTCDHLLDDTLLLSARWSAAGNDVELFVAPGMPHAFMVVPCALSTAHEQASRRWLAARFAPSS